MSKKALLIDADSTIPNLALMKISTYLKSQGYETGFNIDDPDVVYASVIFDRNKHKTDGLEFLYPDAHIDRGGSAISLTKVLPNEIEYCMPDYSLYPDCDYDMGFTTRGCIRNCYFCIVPKKEGKFRIVQHPREFHDPNHKKVMILDNNVLANKEWFMEITDYFIENNLKVSFNQGLDIRLMDKDIAERLVKLKPYEGWRIAFDDIKSKEAVIKGIKLLHAAGMHTRSKLICYVYVNSNEDFDNALERCQILRDLNTCPYVMLNQNVKWDGIVKTLRRWTLPYVFFQLTWDEWLDHRKKLGKVY